MGHETRASRFIRLSLWRIYPPEAESSIESLKFNIPSFVHHRSSITHINRLTVLCLLSHRKPSNRQTIFSPPSSFVTRIEHRGLSDSPYGGFTHRRQNPASGINQNANFCQEKPLFCTMSAEPAHNFCQKRYLQPSGMLENHLFRSTFYLF